MLLLCFLYTDVLAISVLILSNICVECVPLSYLILLEILSTIIWLLFLVADINNLSCCFYLAFLSLKLGLFLALQAIFNIYSLVTLNTLLILIFIYNLVLLVQLFNLTVYINQGIYFSKVLFPLYAFLNTIFLLKLFISCINLRSFIIANSIFYNSLFIVVIISYNIVNTHLAVCLHLLSSVSLVLLVVLTIFINCQQDILVTCISLTLIGTPMSLSFICIFLLFSCIFSLSQPLNVIIFLLVLIYCITISICYLLVSYS